MARGTAGAERSRRLPWALAIASVLALALATAGIAAYESRPRAVSVTDFGARGDGVTDDTRAFQTAIDASHGGSVRIPGSGDPSRPRTYLLGHVVVSRPGTVVHGDGAGTRCSTLLKMKPRNFARERGGLRGLSLLHVQDAPGCVVRDLRVDGNEDAQSGATHPDTASHGIELNRSPGSVVRGVTASRCDSAGVEVIESNGCTVRDSYFSHNDNDADLIDSSRCLVFRNTCSGTHMEALTSYARRPKALHSGWETPAHHNTIVENTVTAAWEGVSLQYSHDDIVLRNRLVDCRVGIEVHAERASGTMYSSRIEDNDILRSERFAIMIGPAYGGAHDIVIERNLIDGTGLHAILGYSGDISGVVIRRNTIRDWGRAKPSSALYVQPVCRWSDVVLAENELVDTRRAGTPPVVLPPPATDAP